VASIDSTNTVGPYSTPGSFTKNQAPAPILQSPVDGAALKYPTDRPVLSWQSVPGMKQYRVEVDDDPAFGSPTSVTTAGTSYAIASVLASSAVRYWRVQGISTTAGVTSAWSSDTDPRSFTISWSSSAVPTLLEPANSLSTDIDDMTFRWSSVAGATSYELEMATNVDFTAGRTTRTTHATQWRPAQSLLQDQYFWRVRALQQNGGPGGWSSVSGFKREWLDGAGLQARPTVQLTDTEPGTAGVQAALEADKITISWTPIRRASSYVLQISTTSDFASPFACSTPHTTWTPYQSGSYSETAAFGVCPWTGGALGSTYYVRVRAVDLAPNLGDEIVSLWSNTARPGEGAPPPAVAFEVVASTSTATPDWLPAEILSSPDGADTPLLTWSPVVGATSYKVAIARDSGFLNPVLAGTYVVTKQTELIMNEVFVDNTVGDPFYWFVLPCNSGGCVGAEQAINIPGRYASFEKRGKAVATNAGAAVHTDTVAVSWIDQLTTSPTGGGIRYYEFEVRDSASSIVDSGKTDSTGHTPVAKTYQDGAYTWRVRAIDAAGMPLAWSSVRTFDKTSSVPTPLATTSPVQIPVLRWNPTAFAKDYQVEIYRGTDPVFPLGTKVGATLASDYPVVTPTSALPAGEYSWRVRQLDATGKPGPWSTAVLPFTVGTAAPSLASPTDGAGAAVPSLVYRWSGVPGAVRYRLQSSTTNGFATLVENQVVTGTAFVPTTSHVGGTQYFWRVLTLNAADDTMGTSAVKSYTALTGPAAPASTGSADGQAFTISWSLPADGGSPVTGFIVRYRQTGGAWTELNRAADVRSVVLTGLPLSTSFEAQVLAVNAVATGPWSNLVSGSTDTVPAAPGGVKVTAGVGSLAVTWSAPNNGGSPITGYVLRYTPTGGGGSSQVSTSGTSYTITGLTAGAAYSVEVAAQNVIGTGPWATSVQGTPLSVTAPVAVEKATTAISFILTKTIVYGGTATVSGTLTGSAGVGLPARTVTIQGRTPGSTSWSGGIKTTTSSTGTFAMALKPTANREYRAIYAGGQADLACASETRLVGVKTKITRAVSANNVRVGKVVTFTGTVSPSHAGKKVLLQRKRSGSWVTVKSTSLSSRSGFAITYRTRTHQDWSWRVTLPGHADHVTGLSAAIKLRVR
jgi:hypothetical protein